MQLLNTWYPKIAANKPHPTYLVVILQDYEGFEPRVLQEFLYIIRFVLCLPGVCYRQLEWMEE